VLYSAWVELDEKRIRWTLWVLGGMAVVTSVG